MQLRAALALGSLALVAVPSSAAAETVPASKTAYLQSGQYQRKVEAAAAPAAAWLRERSAQIVRLKATCEGYGLAVGPYGRTGPASIVAPDVAAAATTHRRVQRRARTLRRRATAAKRRHASPATRTRTRRAAVRAERRARRTSTQLRRIRRAAAAIPARPSIASCRDLPAPAVVFDIDETLLSNYIGVPGSDPETGSIGQFPGVLSGTGTPMPGVIDVYREARRLGMAIFLITARPRIVPLLEGTTERNLRNAGFAWDGLSLKDDPTEASATYKTRERATIEGAGFTIVANLGDQHSDLEGGHAERTFKLPNPFYEG
ncbi:MAG: HAD family acid phosphatase [Solirubrobacteraceae bacterium]